MCRLFAYVSPDTSTADRELGEDGIESFLSLARLHGDGWGWAGVARVGETPEIHKSPLSAAADPDFLARDRHTGARRDGAPALGDR